MSPAQPTLSRRDTLAILMASGFAFTGCATTQSTQAPSLATLAKVKGLRFGSAVGAVEGGITDPRVAELLIRECNIIVPENELKNYIIQKEEAVFNFEPADKIFAFCKSHHISMRGHTLIWARDQYNPAWLLKHDFGEDPKTSAEKMLRDYITRVATRYGSNITSWDVVNEVADEKTGAIRDGIFTKHLGIDVLRIAYQHARELLPKTQLVYNDFMCWEASHDKHREGVLTLLRWFRDNNIPVDALGVQSHLSVATDPIKTQPEEWKKFLDQVVSMGYDLLITELDVNDKKVESKENAERDAVVAQVTREYLDQMLSYKQLKDVLVWGMCDKYNWLQSILHRPDGLPVRPTLYDENFQPKPMRDAVAASFISASKRYQP